MDTKISKNESKNEVLKLISTIISWTIFVLLTICAVFLLYYFIATKIFATKGEKYEPKFSLYTIVSPSMEPNIKVYDVILDLRVDNPEDIKIDDVITFVSTSPETNGMIITHRVISVIKDDQGNYSYQTKGDKAPIEDTGAVEFNNIIGKVALKIPQLGKVQSLFASKSGLILVVLGIALYIILKGLIKTWQEKNGNKPQGRIATFLRKPLYLPYRATYISENNVDDSLDFPKVKENTENNAHEFSSEDDEDWLDLPDLK